MSATVPAPVLVALLAALRRHLAAGAGRADAVGAEIARLLAALDRLPAAPGPAAASYHPVRALLPAALVPLRRTAPDLAALLAGHGGALPWRYGYAPRADAPGLETAMGWAELVGPVAPFASDAVCLGLTLIGPRRHYLPHRHPAVELYRVLAGTADWSGPDGTRRLPPGAFVLHPSGAEHAMRTGDAPLLALYTWSGDVVSPSVWARSPAERTEDENARA